MIQAIYFGNASWQGNRGGGSGPWVAADLENGMYYGGNVSAPSNQPLTHEYVTALLKGRVDTMAILGGDATAGSLIPCMMGPAPPQPPTGLNLGVRSFLASAETMQEVPSVSSMKEPLRRGCLQTPLTQQSKPASSLLVMVPMVLCRH